MQHPSNRTQPDSGKPALLFKTASWIGLKQQVLHLAQFGGSIQVVWGAPGAGKSTFLQLLLKEPGAELVAYAVPESCSLETLFRALLQKLSLRPDPDMQVGQMIAVLRSYCQSLERSQTRAVVVLDDAHHLGSSELATVISILQGNVDSGFGLHLVLLAEPELLPRLDQLQLVDISIHDMPVPAFAPSELNALLAQYYHLRGEAPPSAERVQRLWTQSAGLPGVALQLDEQQSAKPAASASFGSINGWPVGHFAALLLLAMLLVWALLVRQPSEPAGPVITPVNLEPQPVIRSESGQRDESRDAAGLGARTPSAQRQALDELRLDPPESSAQDPAPVPQERPAGEEPLSDDSALAQRPDEAPLNLGAEFDGSLEEDVAERGLAEDSVAATDDQEVEPKREAEPAPQPAPATAPEPTSPTPQPSSPAEAWLSSSRSELAQLPAQGFVLQLMATTDLSAMHHFVTRQSNQEHLRGYTTLRNGQSLHILVEGFYADRESAAAAITNLPAEQRRAGPWPKQVSTVQREMQP